MATPRKHWFRVYESIIDETWDDATLASIVRLMGWLNRRWARNGIPHGEAGHATIPMLELCSLMRRSRPAAALAVLQRCASAVTMRVTAGATSVEIDWPKFSILQEYCTRHPPGDRADTAPSETPPSSLPSEEKTNTNLKNAAPLTQGSLLAEPPQPRPTQSAARRGSAPKGGGSASQQKPPKPAHAAIVAFCEEYKAARGVNPGVPPKDKPKLGEAFQDLGEETFRSSLRIFFKMDEQWIKDCSYSPAAFLARLTRCSVSAVRRAEHAATALASPPIRLVPKVARSAEEEAAFHADVAAMFGTGAL